ncbi:hypothetical protein D3C79_530600 [compost metagenome]
MVSTSELHGSSAPVATSCYFECDRREPVSRERADQYPVFQRADKVRQQVCSVRPKSEATDIHAVRPGDIDMGCGHGVRHRRYALDRGYAAARDWRDVAARIDDVAVAVLADVVRADFGSVWWKLCCIQGDNDSHAADYRARQHHCLDAVANDGRRLDTDDVDHANRRVSCSGVVSLVDFFDDPAVRVGAWNIRSAVNEVRYAVVLARASTDHRHVQDRVYERSRICARDTVAGHPAQRIDLAAVDGQRVRIPRQQ